MAWRPENLLTRLIDPGLLVGLSSVANGSVVTTGPTEENPIILKSADFIKGSVRQHKSKAAGQRRLGLATLCAGFPWLFNKR